MCKSATDSFIALLIGTSASLCLWRRNGPYDRELALFILALTLIQAEEMIIHISGSEEWVVRLIYLTLWLQVLILAWILHRHLRWTYPWLVAVIAIFIIAVVTVASDRGRWSAHRGPSCTLVWSRDGASFLSPLSGWLYLAGVVVPLLLLGVLKSNVRMIILLTYGVLSLLLTTRSYRTEEVPSVWCFLAVGFSFLAVIVPP